LIASSLEKAVRLGLINAELECVLLVCCDVLLLDPIGLAPKTMALKRQLYVLAKLLMC